jgi:acyl-coenzyme A thioesterase PaaI-like protein
MMETGMDMWPQVSIDFEKDVTMCFACGKDNPIGLKLNFEWDGNTAKAEFTPSQLHQGWSEVVHGGIVCCLLDEAMTYAPYFEGINCITAKMEVRIRQPIPIGKPVIIASIITKKTRRLVETRATISSQDGTLMAEGTAIMFVIGTKTGNVTSREGKPGSDAPK